MLGRRRAQAGRTTSPTVEQVYLAAVSIAFGLGLLVALLWWSTA